MPRRVSQQAEEEYERKESTRRENLDVQGEFNKARQDTEKYRDRQHEATALADEEFNKKRKRQKARKRQK